MKETEIKKLFAKNHGLPSADRFYGRLSPPPGLRGDRPERNARVEKNSAKPQKKKAFAVKRDESEVTGYHTTHRWTKTDKENAFRPPWNSSKAERSLQSVPKRVLLPSKNAVETASTNQLRGYLSVLMKPSPEGIKTPAPKKNQTILFSSTSLAKLSWAKGSLVAQAALENSRFCSLKNQINDVFSRRKTSRSQQFEENSSPRRAFARRTPDKQSSRESSSETNKSCSQFLRLIEQTFGQNFDESRDDSRL